MGSRHTFSKVSALAHSLCKDTTKSIFANICASHSCFEHGEQAHILESSNISYMYVGNVWGHTSFSKVLICVALIVTWYRKFLLLFYFFKFFFSKVLVCVALIVTWYRKCTRAPTCQNSFQNRAIRVLVRYTHIFSKGLFIVSLHRKCARALTFQNCTIRVLVRCVLVVRGRGLDFSELFATKNSVCL